MGSTANTTTAQKSITSAERCNAQTSSHPSLNCKRYLMLTSQQKVITVGWMERHPSDGWTMLELPAESTCTGSVRTGVSVPFMLRHCSCLQVTVQGLLTTSIMKAATMHCMAPMTTHNTFICIVFILLPKRDAVQATQASHLSVQLAAKGAAASAMKPVES